MNRAAVELRPETTPGVTPLSGGFRNLPATDQEAFQDNLNKHLDRQYISSSRVNRLGTHRR